jgi:serine/threonine protein kinase
MLHRDISPNNLLLIRPNLEGGLRSGMLIDFDYAALILAQGSRTISNGFRTVRLIDTFHVLIRFTNNWTIQGTPPFMAIDLMLHRDEPDKFFHHELRHDLESILYVILWICTSMDGPMMERRVVDPRFMDLPLHMWFDKDADIQNLGYLKLGHVVDSERAILSNFPPFWSSFKPFVRKLLEAFFPIHPIAGSNITPEKMIDILENAAQHVDVGDDSSDNVKTLEPGSSGTASYNEIFYETTVHQYLVPRKRAGADELTGHQSKKGKNPDVINFENWTPSLEERLSRRSVSQKHDLVPDLINA